MRHVASDAQARMYQERADEYDALIDAEDADGALPRALFERARFEGAVIADVGAGTGRIARLCASRADHVHLIDRAAPMLAVAERRLSGATNVSFHEADVRSLPLPDASVDVAVAGWVFGHFRLWMPEGWIDEVDRAIGEMLRIVRPTGSLFVIETLGTGYEAPRTDGFLEDYFARLEAMHGFARTWIRTDYRFDDVETAARISGEFFGPALVEQIRARRWSRVPECTAIFERRR